MGVVMQVVLGCVFGGAVVAFMVYRQLAANRLIAKKLHTYHHRQRAAFITGSVFNEEFPAKPPPHAAMVKVLASNLQVLAMAVSFDLRWPSFIESMFRAEDAGSAVSTQLVNIMCELEDEPTFPAAMKQVPITHSPTHPPAFEQHWHSPLAPPSLPACRCSCFCCCLSPSSLLLHAGGLCWTHAAAHAAAHDAKPPG